MHLVDCIVNTVITRAFGCMCSAPEVEDAGMADPLHSKRRCNKPNNACRRLGVSRGRLCRRQLQRCPRGRGGSTGVAARGDRRAWRRPQRGESGIDLDGVSQRRPGAVHLQRAHLRRGTSGLCPDSVQGCSKVATQLLSSLQQSYAALCNCGDNEKLDILTLRLGDNPVGHSSEVVVLCRWQAAWSAQTCQRR